VRKLYGQWCWTRRARDDLGGLNLSKVRKPLIESGNMRSSTDIARLEDENFRQNAAEAIAGGHGPYLAAR
jgi:N-acetylmuramoyl-L-alanine amidase